MVVDDSSTYRTVITDLLRNSGLNVIEACDGLEAQEKLQITRPDLVIMDIVMPRMNGYELCRWIKSEFKDPDIPVIMCSTKGEDFDRHWGIRQGGDAYVTKPFEDIVMLTAVKQFLSTEVS